MIQFIFQNSITKIRIYSLPERENDQKGNTSNTNYNIISNSNFNDNLKNAITLIAGSFVKLKDKKLGITQVFPKAYHPQTNGMTELMNKIICNSLTHYINENQKDWSLYYKMVIFSYNICPSSRLKLSPFYLLHGMEANQPIDNKLTIDNELFNLTKSLKQLQKIRDTVPKIIEKE